MKIYFAADHAGFDLKEKIKTDFIDRGFLVEDFGVNSFNSSDDYPDFIYPCVKQYIKETNGNNEKGFCVILGGSGTGEAIVANRLRGIRAVVFNGQNLDIVKLSRSHNNCNVISLGSRYITTQQALEAVKIFQTTNFDGGRHQNRIFKIDYLI